MKSQLIINITLIYYNNSLYAKHSENLSINVKTSLFYTNADHEKWSKCFEKAKTLFITFLIINRIKNFEESDKFKINKEIENSLNPFAIKIRSC